MWIWRKNPENHTEKQSKRLAKLQTKNLVTAKAYQMKLVLQDIYGEPTAQQARHRFKVWCRWVRWAARHTAFNTLKAMAGVANMIESHLRGILNHWKSGLTNAFMEGLNSVFQATKRKARGYRTTEYLTAMLYFTAGKLRLPQF